MARVFPTKGRGIAKVVTTAYEVGAALPVRREEIERPIRREREFFEKKKELIEKSRECLRECYKECETRCAPPPTME